MKDKERINHCKHRYTACGQETIVVVMVVVVVEEPNLVERQRNDQLSTVNIDAQLVARRA